MATIEEQQEIDLSVEKLDQLESEYSSVSDALRVAHLQTAIKLMRKLTDLGYEYASMGNLAVAARHKAGLPNPKGAGALRVETGHSVNKEASVSFGEPKEQVGGGTVTVAAEGASPEIKTENVAKEAVQKGRKSDR